jgi:hypothetical protein
MALPITALLKDLRSLVEDEKPAKKAKKPKPAVEPAYNYSLAEPDKKDAAPSKPEPPAYHKHSDLAQQASKEAHPYEPSHHENAANKHYLAAMHARDAGDDELADYHYKRGETHQDRHAALSDLSKSEKGRGHLEKSKSAYDAKISKPHAKASQDALDASKHQRPGFAGDAEAAQKAHANAADLAKKAGNPDLARFHTARVGKENTPLTHHKASEHATNLSNAAETPEEHQKAELAHRVAAQLAKKAGDNDLADSHLAQADLMSPSRVGGVKPAKKGSKKSTEIPLPAADTVVDREHQIKDKSKRFKAGVAALAAKHGTNAPTNPDIASQSAALAAHAKADKNLHGYTPPKPTFVPAQKPKRRVKRPKAEAKEVEAEKPLETTTFTPPELAKAYNAADQATSVAEQNPSMPMYQAQAAMLHAIAMDFADMTGDKERTAHHKKMCDKHRKVALAHCCVH